MKENCKALVLAADALNYIKVYDWLTDIWNCRTQLLPHLKVAKFSTRALFDYLKILISWWSHKTATIYGAYCRDGEAQAAGTSCKTFSACLISREGEVKVRPTNQRPVFAVTANQSPVFVGDGPVLPPRHGLQPGEGAVCRVPGAGGGLPGRSGHLEQQAPQHAQGWEKGREKTDA